ncbi:MAG: glycosyltransferase [Candidatus Latescibacteria bacterium]|nr:glycosyltransferase [Candidatus Latescibacterota bacterium]
MISPQPFFESRGTPFSVLYRLYALSQLGHHVDLVAYHLGRNIEIANVKIHRIPRIPFINQIAVGPSKRKIILDFFVILKSIQLLVKNEYDLIHSHEEAGFFSTKFAKWFEVSHLYDMHSSLPQQLRNFSFTRSAFIIRCFKKLEEKTIESADAIITICPSLFDYVETLFPGKKQVLIENVVDNELVLGTSRETSSDISRRYNLNKKVKVLYTGTFEPYQGLDLLIRAVKIVARSYSDVLFILVGGSKQQVSHYKAKVKESEVGDNVVFTGQVSPKLIPRFVELTDILVSPRLRGNNTPLKIYSYLRSGKPIVATDHLTHTQVLNARVAMLTKCNPESLADGINMLIGDAKLREEISGNALKISDEKYSLEIYMAKMRKLYQDIEPKRILKE